MPERHLNLFFENLKTPYKAFEVENPAAVGEAVAAIDKLERRPMRYQERIPQKDLSGLAYGIAGGALLLLLLAKLAEAKVSGPAARRASFGLILFFASFAGVPHQTALGAEITREQLMAILAASGEERPDLSRRDLTGLDLSGIDFKRANLFAANLSGAQAQGVNLANANLNRMVANAADFSGADFNGASMFAVVMNGADLTGADLSDTRIDNNEHMTSVKEEHLQELASQTGLSYAHLGSARALLQEFEAVAQPRSVTVATDIRPYPAGLALFLLIVLYGVLPLRERITGRQARIARSGRTSPSKLTMKEAHS